MVLFFTLSLIAQKTLCTEPNSSKFAVDAHNRAVEEIGDLSEVEYSNQFQHLCRRSCNC